MDEIEVLDLNDKYNIPLKRKRKKFFQIIFLIVLVVSFLLLATYLITSPDIKLKKDEEITLNYMEQYKEPGYKAKSIGLDLTKKVKVNGKVNPKKIGTYELTYKVKNFLFTAVAVRKINVVDNENPELTLNGSEQAVVCPNTEYKEEGYQVTDNYDKDLMDKVKIDKNENEIIYTVKDSSGNKTEKIRKLIYEDKEKPSIKLKGQPVVYIYVGSIYKEPGYIVVDNCDSNDNVKITGSVNTNKVGTYTLHYIAKDNAGNENTVTRKVIVQEVRKSSAGCGIAGAIYLTFDDGPNSLATPQILNILREEGVKATFFVTNSGPDALIKRAYNEGHTIGLHTASHNYSKVYASVDAYFNDLNLVSNRVNRITGYTSKFIRFPGGSGNTVSKRYSKGIMTTLTNETVNRGYKYYDWNISAEDAGSCASKSSSCIYNITVKHLSKNKCNMVLMHDTKKNTAEALRNIIRYGKENGYMFRQIDNNTPMVTQGVNN